MKRKQSEEQIDALYARLSQEDEKEGISGSIENQKAILEKYAKDNGFDNPKFFFDDGYSGVTFNRPAFTEIMELAERGKIRTLIVKDHSRLGRNRLVVGQLLEEDFDKLGVRYIAIMDNIDTANGLSDLVPMQDLFNEWHAKNTSQKVRNYFWNKGMSGVPITTKLPYGYVKDPNDKNKWLVDEYAASIVRKIFDLCLKGLGPTQIANQLRAEKILRPYHYWKQTKGKPILDTESPYRWDARIVADILERQEYVGDTVNFKCTTKSFKNKEKILRPKEEWVIFENTHPAIIDRETFAIVQKLRENRCRRPKSGIKSIFAGLLFCADCGSKLNYYSRNNYKLNQSYFSCAAYRRETIRCTSHYIRETAVYDIVLENLQRVLWYVQSYEKEFARLQIEQYSIEQRKELIQKEKALIKAKNRVNEIDTIIQRLYEDNVNGKISDSRFSTMSTALENEQKKLKDDIPIMEQQFNSEKDKSEGLQHFIDKAKKLTRLTELTPEILHEFIEKIVVSKPYKIDGKRHQDLDIYYNGVGIIKEPSPEQMEEYFQEHILNDKQKTA